MNFEHNWTSVHVAEFVFRLCFILRLWHLFTFHWKHPQKTCNS